MYQFQPVIGLEVHVQLKTNSKLFCGCSTEFGKPPNSNICPVCTGYPGVLPVTNRKAIEMTVLAGLALNCKISKHSVFARKNYFYPDLPKAYQISQYELPICKDGIVEIKFNDQSKKIRIKRVHIEEDAGKMLHEIGSKKLDYSLVDYNRAGIPLLEIVTEPDINSPEEAGAFLVALRTILRYTSISDCDMEKGLLRCDANVSIKNPDGTLGTKTEVKNMNSFKSIRDALSYEIKRQIKVISEGGKINQETLLWDEKSGITNPMRSKEESHDYRYHPDPDLVPIEIDKCFIENISKQLPELPSKRKERLIHTYKLTEYDAGIITSEKQIADYFEETLEFFPEKPVSEKTAKLTSNWIITELMGKLNSAKISIENSPVTPRNLSNLIQLIEKGTISGKIGKSVFEEMFSTGKNPENIVNEKGLTQITDESYLLKYVLEAIRENPKAVDEYINGKEQAIGAIVGSVMKKTSGRANPSIVNRLIKENLSK